MYTNLLALVSHSAMKETEDTEQEEEVEDESDDLQRFFLRSNMRVMGYNSFYMTATRTEQQQRPPISGLNTPTSY